MSNTKQLSIENQKALLDFFTLNERECLHGHFKTIFRMATFETECDLTEVEKVALSYQFDLFEVLDKIKPLAISNTTQLSDENQKALLHFFPVNEIECLHGYFKTIFRMASFETVGDHSEVEKVALFHQYELVEVLDKIKSSI